MPEVRIAAQPRTEFGKGAARRTRRAGLVPAVVYGHGRPPAHVALPGHDLMLALKTSNVLLALDVAGRSELTLPKAVQRDPVRGTLEHVDLVLVRRGEQVTVEVPVILTGEPGLDTMVDQQQTTLSVDAEATHIPASLEVDITGLAVGQHISAGQVPLPPGVTLHAEPEQLVVAGLAAPSAAEVEAELAEAEAEVGIEREAPVEERAAEAAEGAAGDGAAGADGSASRGEAQPSPAGGNAAGGSAEEG